MSNAVQIENAFQLLLGRMPLPHEVEAFSTFGGSSRELGIQLIASQEFRRRAMLGEFPAGSTQWVCAEIRDGLKLWVDLMDAGVSAGAIADNWEPAETGFILSILARGSTFLDIGSHLGWFTVLGAHRVGPEGRVYSFEPRPSVFERMRASVVANGFQDRCVLQCLALSDHVGTTSIAVFSDEFNSGHAFMVEGKAPEGASLVTEIPTISLDEVRFDRKIDLIKIDVEGAEGLILRGGRELLQRDKPVIVTELFPRWLRTVSGVSSDEFMTFLRELGYRLFEMTSQGIGREIHSLRKGQYFEEGFFTNIIAVTDNHIDKYLLRPLDGRIEAYEAAIKMADAQLTAEQTARSRDEEANRELLAQISEQKAVLAAENTGLEKEISSLTAENERFGQSVVSLTAENLSLGQNVAILTAENLTLSEEIADLTARSDELLRGIALVRENLAKEKATRFRETRVWLRRQAEEAERLAAMSKVYRDLTQQFAELEQVSDGFANHIAILHSSNTWRACMVLMRVARRMPAPLRTLAVRGAKLTWWTFTGQLSQRYRNWQNRKRSVAATTSVHIPAVMQAQRPEEDVSGWADRIGPVVLIVDDRWPEPDRNAGSVEAVTLVRNLIQMGFEVVFAVASDIVQDERYQKELGSLGVRVLPQNGSTYVQKYIEDNRHVFTAIVLTRVSCGGALFELVRHNCPDAKIIFHTVDLHFLREQRAAALKGDEAALARARETRDREEWLVGRSDLTIVLSETEYEILSVAVPRAPVLHLTLTRDIVAPEASFSKRSGIGFVGGFSHAPNADAVIWMITEIWPLVRQRMPDLTFTIVGSDLPDGLAKEEDGVKYLGPVDDLHAWFETLVSSVAPLRIGAGAKGKVASSLASGLPCVLSTIAAEGMNLTDGDNVLIADLPEIIADKIVNLCNDPDQWKRLSAGGLRFAQSNLSNEANRHRLHQALIKIGVQVPMEVPKASWADMMGGIGQ